MPPSAGCQGTLEHVHASNVMEKKDETGHINGEAMEIKPINGLGLSFFEVTYVFNMCAQFKKRSSRQIFPSSSFGKDMSVQNGGTETTRQ